LYTNAYIKRFVGLFLFALCLPHLYAAEPPKYEIRAVWLTTNYGLDWPSKSATNASGIKTQQDELCLLLDSLKAANFNLVFLQVRTRGDVIYHSTIEPVSKVFSGKYGVLPGYEPLAFAIEECHKRGMECHAWFVTFPVGTERIVREQGSQSVVRKKQSIVKRHKGEWFLDPGMPETTTYLVSLVNELIRNYDVDGIHFDYIRYPEEARSFPDRSTYNKYGQKESYDDWRRNNINKIVTRLYDEVKQLKPWVVVSSAPLGKYNRIEKRPDAGWTAYESVFQDPVNWLAQGKQDMIVPMMYYLHDDFFPFVDNWVENGNGRYVVPGLGAYRVDENEANWATTDITDQIDYGRFYGGNGNAFFRCAHALDNSKGLYDELKNNYYKYPAQLPPLKWLNDSIPDAPKEIFVEKTAADSLKLSWKEPEGEEELTYTVYYSLTDSLNTTSAKEILATGLRAKEIQIPIASEAEQGFLFSVSASNRYRLESEPSPEAYYYQSEYIK
jgi:uncharacterized lipoprotein YddW (UPF0748 family)